MFPNPGTDVSFFIKHRKRDKDKKAPEVGLLIDSFFLLLYRRVEVFGEPERLWSSIFLPKRLKKPKLTV